MFYRDLNIQNREITRPNLIKDCYPAFADAMIVKLKSYRSQCSVYLNQCVKEYREALIKYEQACAGLPELFVADLYANAVGAIEAKLGELKASNLEVLRQLDEQKVRQLVAVTVACA